MQKIIRRKILFGILLWKCAKFIGIDIKIFLYFVLYSATLTNTTGEHTIQRSKKPGIYYEF